MQEQVITDAMARIDFLLQEIEDIMDETQEHNHIFFSQIIGLKRSLKSLKRELPDAERAKHSAS
ncbi:MAG: hypothetical protein FWE08_07780 [Oscillospiraceae bacterium]|nr:hypothetical protein [Oscillospiraceae bacterium]